MTSSRKCLVWVSLFIFSLFGLLIIQFYKIQVIEGDKWTKVADLQHKLVIKEPFRRGLFYSNTSIKDGHPDKAQPFVIDVPKFHLYIDPESIPEAYRDEIANKFSQLLRSADKSSLREQFDKKSRSRKMAMWLDRDVKIAIEKWWLAYARPRKIARNAVYFVPDYHRSYPFGKLLGQVLHTVREERDEKTHQNIPTGGLEYIYNNYLQGKEGKREMLRSPRHPLDTGKVVTPPEHGADVYLTINHTIQAIAEEEIEKAVKKANAKGGWAVLMDPHTGEILALAQYPWFEPAKYTDYFNDPKLREDTKVRAITDPYEPGSVMKPLTLAVCLKANVELKRQGKKPLFSPHEKIATSTRSFPGRSKVIKDLQFHRFLNMYMGLQKSSNVYMSTMINRVIDTLGAKWYRDTLQSFGFGVKTGIELPAESSGMLPMPGKKYANGKLEWSAPTPYSLAMGHNLLANGMQMLRAYSIIANGGYDVRPTLIRKVIKTQSDGTTSILLDNTKEERVKNSTRILEPEIIEEVVKAMKFGTKKGGTASRADIYGYTDAGKTGTSEKIVNGVYSKKDHVCTFLGFAPVKNPRFVMLVTIDDPEWKYIPGLGRVHQAGHSASPVFREIGSRTLQYLGVEPDDPFGYPVGDPRYDPKKADWHKEVESLKELYMQWNQ